MTKELTDSYLRTTARQVGVLPFWLDDCVQEMRIALWQAKEDAPLWAVARYTAIDFWRKQSHMVRRTKTSPDVRAFCQVEAEAALPEGLSVLGLLPAPSDPPTDALLDVAAACEGMSPRIRQMLGLLAQGLTQDEIGQHFGISESRVCQLVGRARKKLVAACLT